MYGIFPILCVASLLLAGCSETESMAQVEGTVTFRGQPLNNALVMFIPKAGPAAAGATRDDGTYQLLTKKPGDGVLIGACKVAIVPTDAIKNPLPIPEHYFDADKSGLTANVQAGNNIFDFKLKE